MIAHTAVAEHVAVIAIAMVAVGVYAVAWSGQRQRSTVGLSAWAAAWVVVLVSASPTFEAVAARSFTGHMVQHLLLIVVIAPLLAMARPVAVLRGWLGRSGRRIRVTAGERRLARWWRSAGPVVAPLAFVGVLFVTHLTSIYDRALDVRIVHHAEHAAYLCVALAVWSVIGNGGQVDAVKRVGTVFAMIAGSALLGVVLLSANAPLVDTYAERLGTSEALNDQRAAASLMWVGGMATSLPLLFITFWRWAQAEQRIAERREQLGELTS